MGDAGEQQAAEGAAAGGGGAEFVAFASKKKNRGNLRKRNDDDDGAARAHSALRVLYLHTRGLVDVHLRSFTCISFERYARALLFY